MGEVVLGLLGLLVVFLFLAWSWKNNPYDR